MRHDTVAFHALLLPVADWALAMLTFQSSLLPWLAIWLHFFPCGVADFLLCPTHALQIWMCA